MYAITVQYFIAVGVRVVAMTRSPHLRLTQVVAYEELYEVWAPCLVVVHELRCYTLELRQFLFLQHRHEDEVEFLE